MEEKREKANLLILQSLYRCTDQDYQIRGFFPFFKNHAAPVFYILLDSKLSKQSATKVTDSYNEVN